MKLSKNKITQLLKVKNQSQKRIKKNKLHVRHKSARQKKPLNLRHKTLKKMKGGGAFGSKLKESDIEQNIDLVQHDFTYYKAKMLEDKRTIDINFKKEFTSFINIVNKLELQFYPELFTKGTLKRLKDIMKDKTNKIPIQEKN